MKNKNILAMILQGIVQVFALGVKAAWAIIKLGMGIR